MFLKRLLVCYALCGVYYSEAEGLGVDGEIVGIKP